MAPMPIPEGGQSSGKAHWHLGGDGVRAQKDRVRAFFEAHTEAYRQSASHKAGRDLERLVAALGPQQDDRLLDVATGAGHTALTLLPRVGEVVALDLTPGMEQVFMREMDERGLAGARFVVGDVEALPFGEASFTLVTCRRAAHHFPDKERALGEMIRVLAPGGRLGLVDMVAPSIPGGIELADGLERIRDDSHVGQWMPEAWETAVRSAGLEVSHLEVDIDDVPLKTWLAPVTGTPELLRRMAECIRRAPPGAREAVVPEGPGGRLFRKRRMVLAARK